MASLSIFFYKKKLKFKKNCSNTQILQKRIAIQNEVHSQLKMTKREHSMMELIYALSTAPLLIPSATTLPCPGDEPVTHFVFGHQVVMVLLEHIQVSSSFMDGFCSLALQEWQGQSIGTGESSG